METPRSYKHYNEPSRWPLIAIGDREAGAQQFFAQLGSPSIRPGRSLVPVVDLTDIADDLMLNSGLGQIKDSRTVFGPGECVLSVGEEGSFVLVHLSDGNTAQRQISYLAVSVSLQTPTADELYPDA